MKYTTAGDLHAPSLVAIIDDVPAGLVVSARSIQADLDRWTQGCTCAQGDARDVAALLSGVDAQGRTTGSSVCISIDNRAYAQAAGQAAGSVPRPGAADLPGMLAMNADDCSGAAQAASPRGLSALVVAASIAREYLAYFGVEIQSYVTRIGDVAMREEASEFEKLVFTPLDIETSQVRCPSAQASRLMVDAVEAARAAGDTLGGQLALVVTGVVAGLGSLGTGALDMKARLAQAAFCVPGVMGASFGNAAQVTRVAGSAAFDAIVVGEGGFSRASNKMGGVEAGLTSGMPLVMRVDVAPGPVTRNPVASVDVFTLQPAQADAAAFEPCMVPGLGVALEAQVAFVLACAYQEKFGGTSLADAQAAHEAYLRRLKIAAR